MRTLGLCIIIKNEKDNLPNLLGSVKGVVDTVYLTDTGSTDGSVEVAEKVCKRLGLKLDVTEISPDSHPEVWAPNISKDHWSRIAQDLYPKYRDDYELWKKSIIHKYRSGIRFFNFSKARNLNFAQAKTDWILWMDGDDTLEGGDLRNIIKQVELNGATGLVLEYLYQTDKEGNVLNRHPKLRAVKNGLYSWTHEEAGDVPIHENLFPLPGKQTRDMRSREVKIRHNVSDENMKDSMQRNIKILRELEKQEGDKPDLRTTFLLGRELFSNGDEEQKEQSLYYLKKFVKGGGTLGESLHACAMISKFYESKGKFREQLKWATRGIGFHPLHPLGYLCAGEAYRNMGRWKEAAIVLEQALKVEVGDMEMIAFSQYVMDRLATIELANAYNELGEHDKAIDLVQSLRDKVEEKDIEQVDRSLAQIVSASNKNKIEKAINVLANSIIRDEDMKKLAGLVDVIPERHAHYKSTIGIKRSLGLNKLWNKGSIVIYATVGIEEWDETSLEKGIGGSETAVIEMAKRWGQAGYEVVVYGDVEEERTFGNVRYVPAYQINWSDEFDIFISWRNIGVFSEIDIKAEHSFLWLHDVPNPIDFTHKELDKIEKVIVLSNYHRSLLPDIPDEKMYITSNGIDSELIEKVQAERNLKQVIYASQPIRGLEFLLDIWGDVKKEVPDAELVWAYGWNNYDIMIERGVGDKEFKDKMVARIKELGVKDLGRLGKKDLYKAFKSSGVFAYPTSFPEINCIVVQEAQACGCYPITTGMAALAETQLVGDKVKLEDFKNKLISTLKTPTTVDGTFFLDRFGWDGIAKNWMNDLFYGVEWEDYKPLVSVVCITARKGMERMLIENIKKQSYENLELIVIDKLYHERAAEVAGLLKQLTIPHLHIPDPERDKEKYKFGLSHAHNAALHVANGELIVFLQDFYEIPEDGIKRFVNLYKRFPDRLIGGVDEQYSAEIDKDGNINWGEKQWTSMWMKIGKGRRISVFAREWETCWAAAPKKLLMDLGGWNIEWDKGHGWDNVDVAFRHIENGGQLIIDEGNKARGIRHKRDWQSDPTHANGQRFLSYAQGIQQSKNPKLIMEFKEPIYSKEIKNKILKFKQQI